MWFPDRWKCLSFWCFCFCSLSLFIDQSGSQYDGEKNRILEMSVGVGRCQMKFVGIFVSNHSGPPPSQHIRWQQRRSSLAPVFQIKWASDSCTMVMCAAATRWIMGQNWRKPFHSSREGDCKDKGDDEVRMASITIKYNTALGAQRTCHRFCLFEQLLLIDKETFPAVSNIADCTFFGKWLTRF